MNIVPIFTDEDVSNLWSVCCPEDAVDDRPYPVFNKLFDDQWYNAKYVEQFFNDNISLLSHPFWNGITIDKAIKKVREEADFLDNELFNIETKASGYERVSLKRIFKPLHNNVYSLNTENNQHRKGKPDFLDPMIRIYAIELYDETLIVTGGGIKLTKPMEGELNDEKLKLKQVQKLLDKYKIWDKPRLLDYVKENSYRNGQQ